MNDSYDICVIGSGAGGAPVAAALARKGLRVVMLERGKDLTARDTAKDEFSVCRNSVLQPDWERGKRELHYGNASVMEENYLWTGTCVGGGTRIMSGFFFPMKREDFKPLTNFGRLEGASHQDWPITYDDLEPYYYQVEKDVGISGYKNGIPDKNSRIPPLKEHLVSSLIDSSCHVLGYNSIPTPRAILSKEYKGRGECSYSGFCGSYACNTGAKASTSDTYVKTAIETGKMDLLDEHYVFKLISSGNQIKEAWYFDRNNVPGKIKAKVFVLACSSIETARLLLNSHNDDYQNGLANSSGQVGKNLTFTIPCEVTGFFPKDKFLSPGEGDSPFIQRSIQDLHTLDSHELKYKRGGTVIFIFPHANPIQRMVSLSYSVNGERVLGADLKRKAKEYFNYNHVLSDTFIEYLPNPDTFVSVSKIVRDFWGIPSANISIRPHFENIKSQQIMAKKIAEIYQEMGAKAIHFNPSPYTAGELQQGTCRFGNDPKTSVLNSQCRSHDIKNLYITDASFMPSGIPVPSTYTIMANALRVAKYIYKNV